jgi:ribosomal-protein-serine acetyltransferase
MTERLPTAHVTRQNRWMWIQETIDVGPITLQRWTVDRANDLDQAIRESLPELKLFMPWATAGHDLDVTTGYLVRSHSEWDSGENFNYAMLTPHGDVVGSCGLMSRRGPGVLEIGYWVHSAHVSKGYATAAALALTDTGLGQPGIERVEIYHDVDNPASGRVAAKAGFHELGPIEVEKKAPSDSGTLLVWTRRRPRLM